MPILFYMQMCKSRDLGVSTFLRRMVASAFGGFLRPFLISLVIL